MKTRFYIKGSRWREISFGAEFDAKMRFQIIILLCLLFLRQFSSEEEEEQELEEERHEEEDRREDQREDEKREELPERTKDDERPAEPPEHPLVDTSLREVEKPPEVYNADSFSFQRFSGPVKGVVEEIRVSDSDPRVGQAVDFVGRPDYSYAYGVHDKNSGNSHTHTQSRDGDAVTGEYRVLQADGLVRIVKYTADATSGFKVVVEYAKMKDPIN